MLHVPVSFDTPPNPKLSLSPPFRLPHPRRSQTLFPLPFSFSFAAYHFAHCSFSFLFVSFFTNIDAIP